MGKRRDLLPLVLTGLIVGVGNLKPIAGGKQVEMDRISAGWLVVEAIEDGPVVADGMNRGEFGGVQETARAQCVHGQKIPAYQIAVFNVGNTEIRSPVKAAREIDGRRKRLAGARDDAATDEVAIAAVEFQNGKRRLALRGVAGGVRACVAVPPWRYP